MSEVVGPGSVAVKLEPLEAEDFGLNFNSDPTYISILNSLSTLPTTGQLNHFPIEQKPQIDHDFESIQIQADSVSSIYKSSSSQLEQSGSHCTNTSNSFRHHIEPKIEVEGAIVLPGSLIVSDTNVGEFINDLNYVNCKAEPTSPQHNSYSSEDPLDISSFTNNPKQPVDHRDEILQRNRQINECFDSAERLRSVYQISSDRKIPNIVNYKCRYCEKVFGKELNLKQHEKGHTGRACCDHCSKSFMTRYILLRHIESKHSGISFKCSDCDKTLATRITLQRHMAIHTKPFKCTRCDLSFSRQTALDKHSGVDHGIRFQCGLCDSSFHAVQDLILHEFSHKPKRTPIPMMFQCNLCDYSCTQIVELSRHKTDTHEVSQAFRCDICEKGFDTAVSYRLHRRQAHLKPRILR